MCRCVGVCVYCDLSIPTFPSPPTHPHGRPSPWASPSPPPHCGRQPLPKKDEKKKGGEGGEGGGDGYPTQLAIRTVMMNRRFMGLGHHAADRVLDMQHAFVEVQERNEDEEMPLPEPAPEKGLGRFFSSKVRGGGGGLDKGSDRS